MWSVALGQGKPDILVSTGFAKIQMKEFDGKSKSYSKMEGTL